MYRERLLTGKCMVTAFYTHETATNTQGNLPTTYLMAVDCMNMWRIETKRWRKFPRRNTKDRSKAAGSMDEACSIRETAMYIPVCAFPLPCNWGIPVVTVVSGRDV